MTNTKRAEIVTEYGRANPLLTAWLAIAILCPEGVDENGEPVDQREFAHKMIADDKKGSYFRKEIARHMWEMRKQINGEA